MCALSWLNLLSLATASRRLVWGIPLIINSKSNVYEGRHRRITNEQLSYNIIYD
jgi:hypothetical protein